MRTAIFLGLISVAGAIDEEYINEETAEIMAWFIFAFIIMDVVEFFVKNTDKRK